MQPVHSTRPKNRNNPLPFAALPHDLAADPRLVPLDLAVVLVVLKYARSDDHAWPSVATLMAAVRRSRRTVQQSLRRLEVAGWLASELAANPTGRVLVLRWRRDPASAPDGAPPAPLPAPPAASPVAPELDVSVKRPIDREAGTLEPRPRRSLATSELAEAATRTADPVLAAELARRSTPPPPRPKPPATTHELLLRLREDPAHPYAAAELLARDLDDRKSWSGFHSRCREAWEGRLDPALLAEAYEAATRPGARNPGAVFMGALRRGLS